MWVDVIHAPMELILSVLVSSMNSAPETSEAFRKTGACNGIRGQRRDCKESTPCAPFTGSMRNAISV